MMMEELILKSLRNMAWERAKGELLSMCQTYWYDKKDPEGLKFGELHKKIKEFIEDIEDNGIAE
jgi:hypothetical protein